MTFDNCRLHHEMIPWQGGILSRLVVMMSWKETRAWTYSTMSVVFLKQVFNIQSGTARKNDHLLTSAGPKRVIEFGKTPSLMLRMHYAMNGEMLHNWLWLLCFKRNCVDCVDGITAGDLRHPCQIAWLELAKGSTRYQVKWSHWWAWDTTIRI